MGSNFNNYLTAKQMVLSEGNLLEIIDIDCNGEVLGCFKHAPASLRDFWLMALAHDDKEYLVFGEERWTYAQAGEIVRNFSEWLLSRNIEPGDRVAIAMRNFPEWIFAHWAVVSRGATVVGLNAWWVSDEMAYALTDSRPKLLIVDEERLQIFSEIAPNFPDLQLVAVRTEELLESATPWEDAIIETGQLATESIGPGEDACVFYTSGTTGRPKGARLSHAGCVTNVMNILAMGQIFATASALSQGLAVEKPVSPPPLISLVATPMFHVTANNCVMQATTLAGGKLVLMHKWESSEALRLIEVEQINSLSAVPMMTRELLLNPEFTEYDTSSLSSLGGGGAAMQPDLPKLVDEVTDRARPAQGYGMTEVCGIITYITGELFLERPESCGPLVPTLKGKIVDEEGKTLPPGEPGELCVKGLPVIKGYLNRDDATEEALIDGWLYTGDIGYFDSDGFLYLVDRAKDMILRGGENIYGAEVEAAIFTHPAILEAVAFGVPDDRLGEEVGVAVHLKPSAMLDAGGLREHMSFRLAAFKIPRFIWFLAEPLPRNANGKFLKRELREVLEVSSAD